MEKAPVGWYWQGLFYDFVSCFGIFAVKQVLCPKERIHTNSGKRRHQVATGGCPGLFWVLSH